MKNHVRPSSTRADARWMRMTAALALLLVCGLPALATDNDGGRGSSSGSNGCGGDDGQGSGGSGGGGFNVDNETIGTLPIVRPNSDGSGTLDPISGLDVLGFDFALELPTGLVPVVVLDAWGEGSVLWEDLGDDRTRLTFRGDVSVLLDEALTTSGIVHTAIDYGIGFRGGEAAYLTPAWSSPTFTLSAGGEVALPLARMAELGFLTDGLQVHAQSAFFSAQSQVGLASSCGLLTVTQAQ